MTVRCPECGTVNSGQSKFCSACGHQVRPQTAGRCPECGAQNPANNIFCDECGHRLVPVDPALGSRPGEGPVRGLSLPRKENTTEDGVPEWLARLRASFSEEEDSGPAASPSAASGPAAAEPSGEEDISWLNELSGPDEIAPAGEEAESQAGAPEGGGALPDWLREAIGSLAAEGEKEEEEAGEETILSPEVASGQTEAPEEEAEPADSPSELSTSEPKEGEPELATTDHAIEVPTSQEDEPRPDAPEDETETTASEWEALKAPTDVGEMEPEALADWLESLSAEPMMKGLEAAEEEKADELPDWLQAVALEAEDLGAGGDSELEEAGLPDWLQALDLEEAETAGGEEPGDWLQGFSAEEEADETGLAQPEPLTGDQPKAQAPERPRRPQMRLPSTGPLVPDELKEWLGDTIGEEDEEMAASRPAVKGTGPLVPPELPDWLAAVEDVPSTGELPGWLLQEDEEGLEEAEEAPEVRPADRPKTAPLPSWLKEDLGAVAAEDVAEAVPGEIPDWLQPPPDMVDTGLARAELPSWLLPPEEADVPARDGSLLAELPAWPGEGTARISDEGGLGLAEAIIPDWLQALKPREATETEIGQPSVVLERAETEGPLMGVRGALPIEGAIVTPPETRPLPKFVVTEQQHAHVNVLKQIIHGGPEPKPEPAPARSPQWWLERGLIPVLILIAVFVPAFMRYMGDPVAMPTGYQTRPEVSGMYNLIESLPSFATVVVAFDYSPAAAGELDAVATPLLRHLMMRQERIVAVSTVPAGPQLAQTTLEKLAPEYGYQYGRDYLILGYIPGGAVGLQAFATAPWELFSGADYFGGERAEAEGRPPLARDNEAANGLGESLREAALILLLTASRDDLVGWMEQVGQLPGMSQVPIAGGLSAALEPWARPYYETDMKQLSGLVTGVAGAAQYAELVDPQQAGTVIVLRESQTAGLAVVALFVVIGLIWGSAAGLSSRSRGNG
jgi:hypothetical protein